MNRNRYTYQESGEKALETFFAVRAIQLLLAGMYFLLGVTLTKMQRAQRREHAFRVRRTISDAALIIETHKNNRQVYNDFMNDHGPSWRERIKALSHGPGICAANIRDLPETVCQIAKRSRRAARQLEAGNTTGQRLTCRAPP